MTTKPFLDERRLRSALETQGFTIDPTSDGYRVLAPDGVGTSNVHVSSIDHSTGRSYQNAIAELVRIGFDLEQIKPAKANGEVAAWKREREEVEALIAEQELETKSKDTEAAAAKAAEADIRERLENVPEDSRRLYELVKRTPGLTPRAYAESLDDPLLDRHWISNRSAPLRAAGLIESTGATVSVRYWIAGEVDEAALQKAKPAREAKATASANGKPSAGPVRRSSQEPADPVVRFRRMGEKAIRLKVELEEIVVAMVDAYAEQENELVDKRKRLRELEQILGRAVDKI